MLTFLLKDTCSLGTSEKGHVHGLLRPPQVPISVDHNKHDLPALKYLKLSNDEDHIHNSRIKSFPLKDYIQALLLSWVSAVSFQILGFLCVPGIKPLARQEKGIGLQAQSTQKQSHTDKHSDTTLEKAGITFTL